MVREARIQRILGGHGIPVPEIVAVCEDASVLGVPFYLMRRLDGTVVTDTVPAHLAPPRGAVPPARRSSTPSSPCTAST
ncbi:phosphotransferase [Streptomyces zhihengii]